MRRSSAFLLAFAIIAFLVVNSASFFRQPYYEFWDLAANSLSVGRAKHFTQLYGPYSRYLFNHPGPAIFYFSALGEWLFYDLLHAVPSPFLGQLLLSLCLVTAFFVASLNMFAHRLPPGRRWIFVSTALGLAVLHFGSTGRLSSVYNPFGGPTAFLDPWSGHSVVLPFLCLLAAGASVGSGQGRDLPWLILAGGCLLEHISESLFVGAVGVVAYLGLLWHHASRQTTSLTWRDRLLAPWRAHPRAHALAAVFLAVLLLPMLLDLAKGKQSNLAVILRHLHDQESDRRTLVRSFAYFLQFGAYAPYKAGADYFGYYNARGFLLYVQAHAGQYAVWLLVLFLCLRAPLMYFQTRRARRAGTAALPDAAVDDQRFLAWAALIAGLAVALALYWGTRQDGQMYYFNAFSNFAIYYFGALVALAVVCSLDKPGRMPDAPAPDAAVGQGTVARWLRLALPAAGAGVVILTALVFAGHLRVRDVYGADRTAALHAGVERAVAELRANHPTACPVVFAPDDKWPVSVGIGLQLARAGVPFVVSGKRWKNTFGPRYDWHEMNAGKLRGGFVPWYVAGPDLAYPGPPKDAPVIPLRKDAASEPTVLVTTPPALDFDADGTFDLDFSKDGNSDAYLLAGWATPDPGGNWSEDPWAALAFRPPAVQGSDVEILVDGEPFLAPAHGIKRQRVRCYFNGALLGPEREISGAGTMRFTVPADLWNDAANNPAPVASLAFEFPDATVPWTLEPTLKKGDPRALAIFFHRIRWRVIR